MASNKGWVYTAVSVLMVVLGGACCWMLYDVAVSASWIDYTFPVLMGVVGLIYLFGDLRRQPEDTRPHKLEAVITPCIAAFRKLWDQEWILKFFGGIALINVAGVIISTILTLIFASLTTVSGVNVNGSSAGVDFSKQLLSGLFFWRNDLHKLVPNSGLLPLVAVLLIILLFALHKHLANIAQEPGMARKVAIVRLSAILLIILCITSFAISASQVNALVASKSLPAKSPYSPPAYMYLLTISFSAIANGFLMAGLFGSLLRKKNGENHSTASFLYDAAKYFGPMTGVYAVTFACTSLATALIPNPAAPTHLNTLLNATCFVLMIIPVFFMHSPVVVVSKELGTWKALGHSLQIWFGNTWKMISFIMIAFMIFFLLNLIAYAPYILMGKGLLSGMLAGPLVFIFDIIIYAWICVAVWEMYQELDNRRAQNSEVSIG